MHDRGNVEGHAFQPLPGDRTEAEKGRRAAESIVRFAAGHGLDPAYVGAALTAAMVGYARVCGLSDDDIRRAVEHALATRNGQRIEVTES